MAADPFFVESGHVEPLGLDYPASTNTRQGIDVHVAILAFAAVVWLMPRMFEAMLLS